MSIRHALRDGGCAFALILVGVGVLGPNSETASAAGVHAERTGFVIFDGTKYVHKPDLRRYGVRPLYIAYEPNLFKERVRVRRERDAMPDEELLRRQITFARMAHAGHLVIDIEAWGVNKSAQYPEEVARSISRYSNVLQQARDLAPEFKIGLFGPLPVHSGYDRLIAAPGSALHAEMIQDNNNLRSLALAVDVIFPIGYTMTADRDEWRTAVTRQIDEARRLNAAAPVYVFLWPRYADYGPTPQALRTRWIERDYWVFQLQTARDLADGIVLWGGWDPNQGRPETWDPRADWWADVRRVLSADLRM